MSKKNQLRIVNKLPKRLRQAHRKTVPTLDLHSLSLQAAPSAEVVINLAIDRFVRQYLYRENMEIEIIVGRGINSNPQSFIDQIPVLRYYTSIYLNRLKLEYRYFESNGVFVIRF